MKLAVGVGSRKSHREKKNPSAREAWTLDKRAGRDKQTWNGKEWTNENRQNNPQVDTSQA